MFRSNVQLPWPYVNAYVHPYDLLVNRPPFLQVQPSYCRSCAGFVLSYYRIRSFYYQFYLDFQPKVYIVTKRVQLVNIRIVRLQYSADHLSGIAIEYHIMTTLELRTDKKKYPYHKKIHIICCLHTLKRSASARALSLRPCALARCSSILS